MGRDHQRGQMEVALSGEFFEYVPGGLARIDHAQRLLARLQFPGQFRPCPPARPSKGHAAEGVPIRRRHGAKFLLRKFRGERADDRAQRRLRRGAKHGGDAVIPRQLNDGPDAGTQIGQGQHLRFIEDDGALGKVVKLAAPRGFAGEKRLEKLHRRGYHHGRIPGFARPREALCFRGGSLIFLQVESRAGMVLQYVVFPEDLAESRGGLLDDGRVGDDVHHPLEPSRLRLRQRKGQGGDRLASARGHCQRVKPGRAPLPLAHARFQNGTAPGVEFSPGRKPGGDIGLQTRPERFHAVRVLKARGPPIHERRGISIVRVHQTGKQHAGEKHPRQPILCRVVRRHGHIGQRQPLLPGVVVFQSALGGALYAPEKGAGIRPVAPAAAVGQPSVMPRHGESGEELSPFHALECPGGGVVHSGAVLQDSALETGGGFPRVVGQPGQFSLFFRPKTAGKVRALFRRSPQVFLYGLLSAILGQVGEVDAFCHMLSLLPSNVHASTAPRLLPKRAQTKIGVAALYQK